jgi:dienelactone hydrolase
LQGRIANAAWGLVVAAALAAPVNGAAQVGVPGGRYGAVMEYDPAASPARTIYRPRDMGAAAKLPIVAWGNGGCAADGGAGARPFLMELASHGYLVLAPAKPGPDRSPPPEAAPAPPAPPQAAPAGPPPGGDATQASELTAAIDWAVAENSRRGSLYFGKLDERAIAVMGHSCGGLQALTASADPRVKTSMIWNSGVYVRPGGRSGVRITKDDLKKLHAPVAYILGGPTDIAYENGTDDVARIDHVPVFLADAPTGHGGTFLQPRGGTYAKLATAWLDWRLKGDGAASAAFVGPRCGYCVDAGWKITRKGMD